MIELIASIAGWVGMALIVIAYFLLTSEKIVVKSWAYHTINFFGGAGLIFYTFINKTWPVMILNALWIIVAVSALMKIINKKFKKQKKKK